VAALRSRRLLLLSGALALQLALLAHFLPRSTRYRRHVSPALANGARYTFLYPEGFVVASTSPEALSLQRRQTWTESLFGERVQRPEGDGTAEWITVTVGAYEPQLPAQGTLRFRPPALQDPVPVAVWTTFVNDRESNLRVTLQQERVGRRHNLRDPVVRAVAASFRLLGRGEPPPSP